MTADFRGPSHSLSTNHSIEDETFIHYGMTTEEVISLTIISAGISVTGTISNILVIIAVVLDNNLRKNCTAILLAALSCFDLLICAVYVPMYIYDINWGSTSQFEVLRNKLGFGLFLGSLNSVFAASLDRFISICFPYLYVEWMTGKSTSIAVFLSWFVAVALTAMSLPIDPPLYSYAYIAFILFLIISFHIGMYVVARRKVARITVQYFPGCRQKLSIWNKSTTVVAMVIITSSVCWAPILFLPVVVSPSSPLFLRLIKICLAFTSLSSAMNPFIFCWRLADFRKALFSSLRRAVSAIGFTDIHL